MCQGFCDRRGEECFFGKRERRSGVRKKKRHINIKLIYTDNEISLKPESELSTRRYIPNNKFPLSSTFIIYDNKIAIVSLKGKLVGVIIENKEISNTLRSIFNLAWEGAEKYQK